MANAGPNAVHPDTETACNWVSIDRMLDRMLDRMPLLVPPQVLVNCCTISDPLLNKVFVASNVFLPSITAVVPSGRLTRTVLPNVTIIGMALGSVRLSCNILDRIAVLTKSNRDTCWIFVLLLNPVNNSIGSGISVVAPIEPDVSTQNTTRRSFALDSCCLVIEISGTKSSSCGRRVMAIAGTEGGECAACLVPQNAQLHPVSFCSSILNVHCAVKKAGQ